MFDHRHSGWLNRRTAARAAAGFAVLALAPLGTAQAALPSPYLFTATRTELTPGPYNGTPGVVAIGDLHSTTAPEEARNAVLCHPGLSFPALPGCQNNVAVIGELGWGTAFLKDAKDSGLTSAGVFDGLAITPADPTSAAIADFNALPPFPPPTALSSTTTAR
jgi:hypothetical protein